MNRKKISLVLVFFLAFFLVGCTQKAKSVLDLDTLIEKLEQVDKDAICKAASSLKLQAIYFMEGAE